MLSVLTSFSVRLITSMRSYKLPFRKNISCLNNINIANIIHEYKHIYLVVLAMHIIVKWLLFSRCLYSDTFWWRGFPNQELGILEHFGFYLQLNHRKTLKWDYTSIENPLLTLIILHIKTNLVPYPTWQQMILESNLNFFKFYDFRNRYHIHQPLLH